MLRLRNFFRIQPCCFITQGGAVIFQKIDPFFQLLLTVTQSFGLVLQIGKLPELIHQMLSLGFRLGQQTAAVVAAFVFQIL